MKHDSRRRKRRIDAISGLFLGVLLTLITVYVLAVLEEVTKQKGEETWQGTTIEMPTHTPSVVITSEDCTYEASTNMWVCEIQPKPCETLTIQDDGSTCL